METSGIVEGLNDEQREAVEYGDGPLLILAGAGSGKTRTLTHRIAYLIATRRADPWQILAVTFTNKAAREMRERVGRLLEEEDRGVWVATFHSTCVRILRRDIGHLGYEPGFTIYDDTDSLAAIKRVTRTLGLSERNYPPRAIRSQIDRLKSRGQLPADVAAAGTLESDRLAEIYQAYQTELRRSNGLDFGDLILLTVRLFEHHPDVLAYYQHRWRQILVDEYQDTNPIQYRLLRLLAGSDNNLCVVGDEDQSIYRFREADIRNILDFEKDFPGAHVVRLERNYRSTQPILSAATAVVENNLERKGKRLYSEEPGGEPIRFFEASDDRGEAAYVVQELMRLQETGLTLGEVGLFYRTHAQSRAFEEELLKYNVPYAVVGGTRFYDRAEIKDALAYLRAVRNPSDTASLGRIINRPARGIGATTIGKLLALAEERDTSLWGALLAATDEGLLPAAGTRRLRAFVDLIDGLRSDHDTLDVVELLARVLDQSGYVRALESEDSIEAEGRLENLRELMTAAEEFDRANAEGGVAEADELSFEDAPPRCLLDLFLENVTLYSEADNLADSSERLAMMTVHVAKGLEFPAVFVVGMEEGLFPHFASLNDPSALEEERRIFYVAMTRAKQTLYLTNATVRRLYGQARYNPPSRFLAEIPEEFITGRVSRDRPSRAAAASDRRPLPSLDRPAPKPAPAGPHVDFNEGQWEGDELPPIEAGTRVEHPVFGTGTIAEVVGSGRGTKIRVRFDRAGLKTIVLRYAQLRLIS